MVIERLTQAAAAARAQWFNGTRKESRAESESIPLVSTQTQAREAPAAVEVGSRSSAQTHAQEVETGRRSACKNRGMADGATQVCVACGKSAVDVRVKKLLKCSACTIEPKYCSVECQHACWPAHKAECKANRKPA